MASAIDHSAEPARVDVIIETERLLLRRWQRSDRRPWRAMSADPEVMTYLLGPMPRERADAAMMRFDAEIAVNRYGLFALEARSTGAFLGFVGLRRPDFRAPFNPSVEIGWRLARHAWGQGYAAEAAAACLDHGFSKLGMRRIVSFTSAANLRSVAVMERIGLQRRATWDFDHPHVPAGHPLRHHIVYALDAEEYAALSR